MKNSPSETQDTEVLVKAIEKVLRQITKMVIGRLGFPKYLTLIRKIFIEEAEKVLKKERDGARITMSELGLLTGIDTRTLAKVRKSGSYQQPIAANKAFFTDLTPEATVVEAWKSNPEFLDSTGSQEPLPLKIWGSEKSFEALVKLTIKSRGITVQSLLNRLLETGTISLSEDEQTVHLQPEIWFSYQKTDTKAVIQTGLFAVGKHLDTVQHNIRAISSESQPRFERIFWSTRIDPSLMNEFRNRMSAILEETSQQAVEAIEPFETEYGLDDSVSAGVGFYYFDSEVG